MSSSRAHPKPISFSLASQMWILPKNSFTWPQSMRAELILAMTDPHEEPFLSKTILFLSFHTWHHITRGTISHNIFTLYGKGLNPLKKDKQQKGDGALRLVTAEKSQVGQNHLIVSVSWVLNSHNYRILVLSFKRKKVVFYNISWNNWITSVSGMAPLTLQRILELRDFQSLGDQVQPGFIDSWPSWWASQGHTPTPLLLNKACKVVTDHFIEKSDRKVNHICDAKGQGTKRNPIDPRQTNI